MTGGEQIAGVATYGYPRTTRRPAVSPPEPVPTVCPACLTDQQTDVCPTDCLTRKDKNR